MGKGSDDTRSPDYEARREAYDRIFGDKDDEHPRGSCGGYCENCEGGCDES